MSASSREIEAKFYIEDMEEVKARLQHLEARLIHERILETNIRFDLPDGSLRSEGRVLRLRQDTSARLTYKGASRTEQGVLDRTEIEFIVEEFDKAKQFLEALGYQKLLTYEKYRSIYELDACQVMLDDLPIGHFVEIEGQRVEDIQHATVRLELDMGAAITKSYTSLFESARKALGLTFQDLSYENFADIKVTAENLGVRAADSLRH
jgi:adenylate cyclase class 2